MNVCKLCVWKAFDYLSHWDERPYRIEEESPVVSYSLPYQQFFSPATEILPGLFLGSSYNAATACYGAVINVTEEVPCFRNDINIPKNFLRIPCRDTKGASIFKNNISTASKTIDFLDTLSNRAGAPGGNNNTILVHCFAGCSRSVAVVLFYLCVRYNNHFETIEEALKFVSKKEEVRPNVDFLNEMQEICDRIVV